MRSRAGSSAVVLSRIVAREDDAIESGALRGEHLGRCVVQRHAVQHGGLTPVAVRIEGRSVEGHSLERDVEGREGGSCPP